MADRQPRYCQICKTYRVFEGEREVEPCACEERVYDQDEGTN